MMLRQALVATIVAACGNPQATRPTPKANLAIGHVLGKDNVQVAGATVAIQRGDGAPLWVGVTGPGGRFEAPTDYETAAAITVTSANHAPLYVEPALHSPKRLQLRLQPSDSESRTIRVEVSPPFAGAEPAPFVRAAMIGGRDGEYFYAKSVDGVATFAFPKTAFVVKAHGSDIHGEWYPVLAHEEVAGPVVGFPKSLIEEPPSEAIVDAIREVSQTVEGHGIPQEFFDSLRKASVIGLGEATHGTHEFMAWKRELIVALAKRGELRAVAIEANFAEALAIDEILQTGQGDLAAALAGLHFWIWDVEEVLQLLTWLRDWNKAQPRERRIRFVGIDSQFVHVTAAKLLEQVRLDLPKHYKRSAGLLSPLRANDGAFRKLGQNKRKELVGHLETLQSEYEMNELDSGPARTIQRQLVTSMLQALHYGWSDFVTASNLRDQAMAANALWVRKHYAGTGQLAIWSHNSHVAKAGVPFVKPMGFWLDKALQDEYVSIGFSFSKGRFRVRDSRKQEGGVEVMELKPSPPHFAEAGFARVADQFLLDLSKIRPGSEAHRWLRSRRTRTAGAAFSDEFEHSMLALPDLYDHLGYVRVSTPTHPTATGVRPPGS